MSTAHYLLHGLRISSDVMLPAASPHGADRPVTPANGGRPHASGHGEENGRTDVRIELLDYQPVGAEPPPGNVILDHHVQGHRQYVAARTGERIQLRVPGYGDFEVADGYRQVVCRPDPRVAPAYLPLVLAGRVLSFVMALAGHTVLCGGAVEVADRAIAVAGPPGAGTSTLTAWLCAAGARLVTDDVLRVDPDGTCHRGGLEVRLRDHAQPLAAGVAQSRRRARRTVDGRHTVRPLATQSAQVGLGAILIPRSVPGSRQLAVRRMDVTAAATALAHASRTLGWRVSRPVQALSTTVSSLAAQIGVHAVDVPWGPPFDPDIPLQLLELLGLEPPTPSGPHGSQSTDGGPSVPPATTPPAAGSPDTSHTATQLAAATRSSAAERQAPVQ